MVSQEFETAAKEAGQLNAKPDQNELLTLYAHFKQAKQDPPIDKSTAPGTFDLKGKAKRKAWQKLVDDKVTPQQAEQKYIALVNEMKDKYGFDPNKKSEVQ